MKNRINLERISVLLLDAAPQGLDIMNQVFTGFGARKVSRASSIDHARHFISTGEVDLIVVNDELNEGTGYDFVHWLRRIEGNINMFAPVIIVSGHTRRSNVDKARDCGANFMVAKPVSPQVMLERVMWVSREKRPFLEAGNYIGPDRRHHDGLPAENLGRRRGDRPVTNAADEFLAAQAAANEGAGPTIADDEVVAEEQPLKEAVA